MPAELEPSLFRAVRCLALCWAARSAVNGECSWLSPLQHNWLFWDELPPPQVQLPLAAQSVPDLAACAPVLLQTGALSRVSSTT